LCWYGSLWEYRRHADHPNLPEYVNYACQESQDLIKNSELLTFGDKDTYKHIFMDSQGLAYSLMASSSEVKKQEAIAAFQSYRNWTGDPHEQRQREEWSENLAKNKTMISAKDLDDLLGPP
jgi:hypothetical protein